MELLPGALAVLIPEFAVCVSIVREWLSDTAWNGDLASVRKLCKVAKVSGDPTEQTAPTFLVQCVKRFFCTTHHFKLRVAAGASANGRGTAALRKLAAQWPTASDSMEGNVKMIKSCPSGDDEA